MKTKNRILTLIPALLIPIFGLVIPTVLQAAPNRINFQGSLTDSGGTPVTDPSVSMTFRVYDDPLLSAPVNKLWEETQTVNVLNGIYNVLLGSGTTTFGSFDPALFSTDNRWLEVEVNAEVLAPRQQVTSVAFALQAQVAATAGDADTVDGQHASDLGDITAVNAGMGLAGGGISGAVTLDINVPLDLAGPGSYVFKGSNSNGNSAQVGGNTNAIIGTGTLDAYSGVKGQTSAQFGTGLEGMHISSGNYGRLGTPQYGAYGRNGNGNYGYLGGTTFGAYGYGGTNSTSGYLGGNLYGVYGEQGTGSYAGYFQGNVNVTGSLSVGGGITGFTETDPVFGLSPASGITSVQKTNWDTAFSWGNHTSAGYDTTDDAWTGTGNIYTTSGNVGIGTSSPGTKLVIAGDGSSWAQGFMLLKNNNNDAGFRLYSNILAHHIYNDYSAGNKLRIVPNGSPAGGITIPQDGKVGIGVTSPADMLSVGGDISGTVLKSTTATGTAPLQVSSTTMVPNLNAEKIGGYTLAQLLTLLDARYDQRYNIPVPQILDAAGVVGYYSSMQIGSDGNPMIAYADLTNFQLKVIHCTTADCSTADTPVVLDTLSNFAPQYISMAISPNPASRNPLIAYYDTNNGDLKVVNCTNTSCSSFETPLTLESTGDVGQYVSLAYDPLMYPLMSYYDATNKDLMFLRCTGTNCAAHFTPIILDSTADSGRYSSLAMEGGNFPVIAYQQKDTTAVPPYTSLKMIRCTHPWCTTSEPPVELNIVYNAARTGSYTDIAMGSDGFPVIAFSGDDVLPGGTNSVYLLTCNDSSCGGPLYSRLDNIQYRGIMSSVAIGPDGFPIVAYYNNAVGDLKIVHCLDTLCSSKDTAVGVDTTGNTGAEPSLAISVDGNPVISYTDYTNTALKVDKCNSINCN